MNFQSALNSKSFVTQTTAAGRSDFTQSVRGAAGQFSTKAPKTEHDKLVEKTRTWVAQTFFGTLLKQMRDSPFKSELFSGGRGGEAFAGLQDQHLAEKMARGAGSKLVNGMVRRIEAAAAYRKHQKPSATGSTASPSAVGAAAPPDNRTDPRRKDANNGSAGHGSAGHGSGGSKRSRTNWSPHVAPALRA